MRSILMKHMMSVAADLPIEYLVQPETKTVSLHMPFFDSCLVESFVRRRLVEQDGLDVVRDDNSGWMPPRPAWHISIEIGLGQWYTLEVTRLMVTRASSDCYSLALKPLSRET